DISMRSFSLRQGTTIETISPIVFVLIPILGDERCTVRLAAGYSQANPQRSLELQQGPNRRNQHSCNVPTSMVLGHDIGLCELGLGSDRLLTTAGAKSSARPIAHLYPQPLGSPPKQPRRMGKGSSRSVLSKIHRRVLAKSRGTWF